MKDIELVIKIPEEIRLALINDIQLSPDQKSFSDSCISQAIINGKLLPKGHGRIGDLDQVLTWMIYKKGMIDELKCGEITPVFKDATILEADTIESE